MVSRDILGEMCEGDRVLNGISKKFDYIFSDCNVLQW